MTAVVVAAAVVVGEVDAIEFFGRCRDSVKTFRRRHLKDRQEGDTVVDHLKFDINLDDLKLGFEKKVT